MYHDPVFFRKSSIMLVIIPGVRYVSCYKNHVELVKQFNAVTYDSCSVAFYVQNQLIFRMKVPHTSCIADVFGDKSASVIITYLFKFRYHQEIVLAGYSIKFKQYSFNSD